LWTWNSRLSAENLDPLLLEFKGYDETGALKIIAPYLVIN
jgi:hypothetical protein